MKKLLSLLSVLTISGSAIPTTIANKPYIITAYDNIKLKTKESKIVINGKNDMFTASGIVLNNKLYFGSTNNGKVYEYDPATGQQKIVITAESSQWKPEADFKSPGVILKNKLYFASFNGKVYEYDPQTQKQKVVITAGFSDKFYDSCIVLNNKIYAQTTDEDIYEYDPATGQQQETTIGKNWKWDYITFLNNKLYIVINDKSVYEYDYETQEQKFLFKSKDYITSKIVILNNKVYFQGNALEYAHINEYDLLTKQEKEITSRLGLEFNGNALKNKLYFNTNRSTVYEYDPQTQKLNNIIVDNKGSFLSSGVIFNNKLYFGTNKGDVYEYDPATQESKIVTILDDAIYDSGTVLNNKIYFGTFNHVYEYDPN